MSSIQAPRGTFDVLPADAERRTVLAAQARRILGGAGYGRIETPTFEATELFARGVGGATDIVRKEMYSFDDGGGRSLTLRPEGTAPIARAYMEHGMHKLPQPVKLWYLCTFFRAEAPQKGRYRQFWQVGAEAIGAAGPETDAELILLLSDLLNAVGVRGVRLRLSSLGTPETRAEYRDELTAFLRAHEDGLSRDVIERIDLNPMRAFDASDERTRETMRAAPLLLDRLARRRRRALRARARAARRRRPRLRARPDARARPRLLRADRVRVHLRRARGAVGGRRRGTLRRPDRAAGRQADAWRRLGGGRRADPDVGRGRAGRRRGLRPVRGDRKRWHRRRVASRRAAFDIANEARRAGLAAQMELAGRSLKGQLKHADRLGARYVAIVADGEHASLKNMESGDQKEIKRGAVVAAVLRGERL